MITCKLLPGILVALQAVGLFVSIASGEQLLKDTEFSEGKQQPSLAGWCIDPVIGGNFKIEKDNDDRILRLTGVRIVDSSGKQDHAGRLIQTDRVAIIPGRQYTLTVEARGEGRLALGAVEFPDKYSPVRQEMTGPITALTPQWQTFTWTFTPSDGAMFISPFFETYGWLGHVDLKHPALEGTIQPGKISIEVPDFVFVQGKPLEFSVSGDHSPLKLLLYGPGGHPPGPGGEYGGSDAWVDHFQQSMSVDVSPTAATAVQMDVPATARQGFYRIVAVDPISGQTASAVFCIYPKALVDEFHALAEKINLPEGTRLVFLGDSLTDFFRGRNYVDLVSRAIAWRNGSKVKVFNAGVGGNNIGMIEARLEKDVIALKPTDVFIFEGANDCKINYNPATGLAKQWAYPYGDYEATYRRVIDKLSAEGARVGVMTMTPGDQSILEPFRDRARTYGQMGNFFCLPEETARAVDVQKKLANELRLPLIQTNEHLRTFPNGKANGEYLNVDDGVHLSEYGNREVALSVLRYLAKSRN